jgi:tetratricopeptide (TPR) repeat protein
MKGIIVKALILLLYFINLSHISAQESKTQFAEAQRQLQQKQYDEAIESYVDLIEKGFNSEALYYNLGIAYFESGQFPESILYFEKALKVNPKNKAAQHNLELANKKIDQEFIRVEAFFLYRWWKNIVMRFNLATWTFIIFTLLLLSVISFYFYLFATDLPIKKWGMRAFYPLLFLFFISLIASWSRYTFRTQHSKAIVLVKIEIYTGPDQRSEKLYDLEAGTAIEIIDSLENWYKVQLINKEYGWIQNEGFERI